MPVVHGIALGRNQDGRLELVITVDDSDPSAAAPHGAVWHLREARDDHQWPPQWQSLDVPWDIEFGGGLAIAGNQEGRLEIVATTADALLHSWQTAPNGDECRHASLPGPPDQVMARVSPGLAEDSDGRIEAFVLAHTDNVPPHPSEGELWTVRQDPTAPSGWSSWLELGGPSVRIRHRPAVASNRDGHLEVFVQGAPIPPLVEVIGNPGTVHHIWQDPTAPDGWTPRPWHSLKGEGGPYAGLAVGAQADGRLVIFAIAEPSAGSSPQQANTIWHREQALAGGWSAWRPFTRPDRSPTVGDPAMGLGADQQLQLWLRIEHSGRLYQLKQTAPNGTGWDQREWDFQSPPAAPGG